MAHDNHAHDHGTGGESHGSVKSYLIGFVLAVVLTVIPFWMVMSGDFSRTVNGVVIAITRCCRCWSTWCSSCTWTALRKAAGTSTLRPSPLW
jgi:hypothetical protein